MQVRVKVKVLRSKIRVKVKVLILRFRVEIQGLNFREFSMNLKV
jgi:hypothetical protein